MTRSQATMRDERRKHRRMFLGTLLGVDISEAKKRSKNNNLNAQSGGERGIRTLETVSCLHTFQACAFDHSATSPQAPAKQVPAARCPSSRLRPACEVLLCVESGVAQIHLGETIAP